MLVWSTTNARILVLRFVSKTNLSPLSSSKTEFIVVHVLYTFILFLLYKYFRYSFEQMRLVVQMSTYIFCLDENKSLFFHLHFVILKLLKLSRVMRKADFEYAKPKSQISCAVNGQLRSAFVFAT